MEKVENIHRGFILLLVILEGGEDAEAEDSLPVGPKTVCKNNIFFSCPKVAAIDFVT